MKYTLLVLYSDGQNSKGCVARSQNKTPLRVATGVRTAPCCRPSASVAQQQPPCVITCRLALRIRENGTTWGGGFK